MDTTNDLIFKYDAFISYRHGDIDEIVAEKLHKDIESYTIPLELRKMGAPKQINRIFRDKEELPTSSNLTDSIREALKLSRFLIVVCSPRTPESKWVYKEIEYFKELEREDRILVILIKGSPEQSFPKPLFKTRKTTKSSDGEDIFFEDEIEPLGANICADTPNKSLKLLKTEKFRIIAPLIGCSFDDIIQRHKKEQKRKLIRRSAIAFIIFVMFISSLAAVLQRWAAFSSKTLVSEVSTNLNSISSRYEIMKVSYLSMKSDEIIWKNSLEMSPTIANMTLPNLIKNSFNQHLSDLKNTSKDYPIYWDGSDKKLLPFFADLKGEKNERLRTFYKQLKILNDNWESIQDELARVSSRVNNVDSGINQEKLILAKIDEFFANSKLSYTLGTLAIKDLDNEKYQKELNALNNNSVIKKIEEPMTVPTSAVSSTPIAPNSTSQTNAPDSKPADGKPVDTPTALQAAQVVQPVQSKQPSQIIQSASSENNAQQPSEDISKTIKELDDLINASTPDMVAKAARTLRDLGKFEDAAAQYDKYEKLFKDSDPYAKEYAAAGRCFSLNQKNLGFEGGLYIYAIADGSEGAKAGFKAGEIIVKYDGKATSYAETLQSAMQEALPGSSVEIEYLRLENNTFTLNKVKVPVCRLGVGLLVL